MTLGGYPLGDEREMSQSIRPPPARVSQALRARADPESPERALGSGILGALDESGGAPRRTASGNLIDGL